ncbi:MAG: ATP-binding cassette domain-containing protein [Xylophilus ampelinus]
MIDIRIALSVADRGRRFELQAALATEASFAALYGPSGAGKSLTLQAVAGLLRPAAGRIRLGDRTLFDAARGIDVPTPERRVGYLFQDYALFPHLSVRQNVGFGLGSWLRPRLTRSARDAVEELLEGFGLAGLADSRPGALSGGQRQRVALARALACRPRALLLDEPFAALNPMLREALRQDLAKVCRAWRIPVLMITHDADDVLALADVAFVYAEGRVARSIDLRDGTARDAAREALGVGPALPETPLRARLRRLLSAGGGSIPGIPDRGGQDARPGA